LLDFDLCCCAAPQVELSSRENATLKRLLRCLQLQPEAIDVTPELVTLDSLKRALSMSPRAGSAAGHAGQHGQQQQGAGVSGLATAAAAAGEEGQNGNGGSGGGSLLSQESGMSVRGATGGHCMQP
jgi:hypothetical protein